MSHRAAQRISGLPEVAMQILMDQLFSNPLTETGPLNFQQPALCAGILASSSPETGEFCGNSRHLASQGNIKPFLRV